jgi:hypothetical protein
MCRELLDRQETPSYPANRSPGAPPSQALSGYPPRAATSLLPWPSNRPFRCCKSGRQIIHAAFMRHIRFPLSLRTAEPPLSKRGIEISHKNVRHWWCRFGFTFAEGASGRRAGAMRACGQRRWHLTTILPSPSGQSGKPDARNLRDLPPRPTEGQRRPHRFTPKLRRRSVPVARRHHWVRQLVLSTFSRLPAPHPGPGDC